MRLLHGHFVWFTVLEMGSLQRERGDGGDIRVCWWG